LYSEVLYAFRDYPSLSLEKNFVKFAQKGPMKLYFELNTIEGRIFRDVDVDNFNLHLLKNGIRLKGKYLKPTKV
jgi:hypothetical protein